MAEPILTLGDIEPERPTVAINHRVPDGPWQAFKARHFDVLLRLFPVRYEARRDLYPMRLPNQLGLAYIAQIQAAQRELATYANATDAAAIRRVRVLLRQLTSRILEAPASVIEELTDEQHIQLLQVFPSAAAAAMPTKQATERPPISADSSPDSPSATTAIAGSTG